MPPVVLAAAVCVLAPFGLVAYLLLVRPQRTVAIARRNLTRGLVSTVVEVGGLESRGTGAGALLRALTPERSARQVRRLLDTAGRPAGWTMTGLLWAKLWIAVGLIGLALLVAPAEGGPLTLLGSAAVVLGGYHVPELVLWGRGRDRQAAIARELPDTLDQMTIAVEAGLGFEAALARAAGAGKGPLAQELVRTLQDVAVGRPRREAYEALVRRTQVLDLKRFVAAINQADSYGVPIADVLRVQAADMRVKRLRRAEEVAAKVPVKVNFPLMFCILPALLIVVVAPAVMALADTLG